MSQKWPTSRELELECVSRGAEKTDHREVMRSGPANCVEEEEEEAPAP